MENKEITYRNIGAIPGKGNAYVVIESCGGIDVNKYKAFYDDFTGYFTLYPFQSLYGGLWLSIKSEFIADTCKRITKRKDKDMKKIKLKECPFCGGEAEIVPCSGLLKAVRVRCKRCKCSTPPVGVATDGKIIKRLADESAAEVWNSRSEKAK